MARVRILKTKRTRQHEIADLAELHVQRQVVLGHCTAQAFDRDYGTDFIMLSYGADGESENGHVFIQVKATESLRLLANGEELAFRVARRHLVAWLAEEKPFILVVYDASADIAYWLYVQAYFERLAGFEIARAGATVTVRIPTSNILNPLAVRRFVVYKDRVLALRKGVIHHDN